MFVPMCLCGTKEATCQVLYKSIWFCGSDLSSGFHRIQNNKWLSVTINGITYPLAIYHTDRLIMHQFDPQVMFLDNHYHEIPTNLLLLIVFGLIDLM